MLRTRVRQEVGEHSYHFLVISGYLAIRQARFASFPSVLVIHAKKFQLVNWVPTKLGAYKLFACEIILVESVWFIDVPLVVPDEVVLDEYIGHGIQPGEIELPGDQVKEPG